MLQARQSSVAMRAKPDSDMGVPTTPGPEIRCVKRAHSFLAGQGRAGESKRVVHAIDEDVAPIGALCTSLRGGRASQLLVHVVRDDVALISAPFAHQFAKRAPGYCTQPSARLSIVRWQSVGLLAKRWPWSVVPWTAWSIGSIAAGTVARRTSRGTRSRRPTRRVRLVAARFGTARLVRTIALRFRTSCLVWRAARGLGPAARGRAITGWTIALRWPRTPVGVGWPRA